MNRSTINNYFQLQPPGCRGKSQHISKEAEFAVLEATPARWRLFIQKYRSLKDVTNVPYTSGTLTKDQLIMTQLTAGEIVNRFEPRELKTLLPLGLPLPTSHLVNCLTNWLLQDGLQQARELDEALVKSGRLKGPFIAWSSNSYKIEFSGIDAI